MSVDRDKLHEVLYERMTPEQRGLLMMKSGRTGHSTTYILWAAPGAWGPDLKPHIESIFGDDYDPFSGGI